MLSALPGEVIDQAKLLPDSSVRHRSCDALKTGVTCASVREAEPHRQCGLRRRKARRARDGGVVVAIQNEIIHQVRRNGVRVIELRNHPWLWAPGAEKRAHRTCTARLHTSVAADAKVELLLAVDVPVDASVHIVFGIHTAHGAAIRERAWNAVGPAKRSAITVGNQSSGEAFVAATLVVRSVL